MKTLVKNSEKRIYNNPEIFCIKLDNEISLTLDSTPPEGPGETGQSMQINEMNPFKDSIA